MPITVAEMDLRFTPEQETFRRDARSFLQDRLADGGTFAQVRGRGGPGDEHELFEERWAWEQELGTHGWIGLGWPTSVGARGVSLLEQVVFYEEYARAGGPGRIGIVNEGLIGPTIVHFANTAQQAKFLPGILKGTEIWCQGYSEPNAGSDLANLATRAERDGEEWVIHGQKVWTSLAHWAHWCFVLCRTDREAPKHKGISYVLCPMDQPGIEIRPIVQITGNSEFNEVFFDGARANVADTIGGPEAGWKVAMGTLAFERGASTLGQQLAFENELRAITAAAQQTGAATDPVLRQRLADSWIALRIMRMNAMRSLSALETGGMSRESSIHKLYWANFHRSLGELAVDVGGAQSMIADGPEHEAYPLNAAQRIFLYSRADTIYGGSNQVQRNIIGERALGLAQEPKV